MDTLLQTVVFTIFGDQFDEHEEILLLQLFERMLLKEFQQSLDIGEFMRSNSALTKMLSALLKRTTYHKFLVRALSEPLEQVLLKDGLDLEINPSRIYREIVQDLNNRGVEHSYTPTITDEEAAKLEPVKQILEPRIRQVYEYTALFLKHIFESVRETPYGIRYVCKKILGYGRERFRDSSRREIFSLVGGFIFLRFINPAIATCDTDTLKLVSTQITSKQRNNLKIICKLLQNLSNGVEFGSKEQFMVPLNGFLVKYHGKMYEYFERLCEVDEIEEILEMNRFEEWSRETKTINISHNELALVHNLCKQNLDNITKFKPHEAARQMEISEAGNGGDVDREQSYQLNDKNDDGELDPIAPIIQQLDKLGTLPEKLSSSENYSFDLKLVDPEGDIRLEEAEKQVDELHNTMIETSKMVSIILRQIPTLPSVENVDESFSLEHVLLAAESHAAEKDDDTFAADIARALKLLERLEELRRDDHSDSASEFVGEKHRFLLQEIAQDAKKKTERLARLQKNRLQLEQVMLNVRTRHDFLSSQLSLFKQFLQNALVKAFNPAGSSSSVIGPFTFKFSELQKNGVVESTTLPKPVQGMVRVKFTSTEPGRFHVVASAAGVSITSDLELADLLERQSRGETTIEVDQHVRLDLEILILWLNKLFVLGDSKKNKITVIKKPKRHRARASQK